MDHVEHDLSPEQWDALRSEWSGCAYCRVTDKPLQRDCVLALSRGGRYTLENIVPACRSCNTSKCNDEVHGSRAGGTPLRTRDQRRPRRAPLDPIPSDVPVLTRGD